MLKGALFGVTLMCCTAIKLLLDCHASELLDQEKTKDKTITAKMSLSQTQPRQIVGLSGVYQWEAALETAHSMIQSIVGEIKKPKPKVPSKRQMAPPVKNEAPVPISNTPKQEQEKTAQEEAPVSQEIQVDIIRPTEPRPTLAVDEGDQITRNEITVPILMPKEPVTQPRTTHPKEEVQLSLNKTEEVEQDGFTVNVTVPIISSHLKIDQKEVEEAEQEGFAVDVTVPIIASPQFKVAEGIILNKSGGLPIIGVQGTQGITLEYRNIVQETRRPMFQPMYTALQPDEGSVIRYFQKPSSVNQIGSRTIQKQLHLNGILDYLPVFAGIASRLGMTSYLRSSVLINTTHYNDLVSRSATFTNAADINNIKIDTKNPFIEYLKGLLRILVSVFII